MKIEKVSNDQMVATLTVAERDILANCVNYLCYGNRPEGFDSLIGVKWEDAAKLLNVLNSV
jgi:hypothetical protein